MAMNAKKALAGLKADGISVNIRSLAQYMSSNCVLVSPHIGRARCYIPMTDSAYGIDLSKFTEEGGAFYKDRVSHSHINFIPPVDETELGRIEKRLRRAVEVRTLTDSFMPMSVYDDLKEEFEKIRSDYFEKRDEICQKWDFLNASFEDGVDEMLKGIAMPDTARIALKKSFMSQVPSPEKYKESFTMTLHVRAFPAESSAIPEGLDSSISADIKESWSEEVVQTALLSIENAVGLGWSKLNSAMRQYLKDSTIRSGTISTLAKFANELSWKNVFKNPLLSQLSGELKGLATQDVETQAEVIETAIGYVYEYAKDVRIDLNMDDCPYKQAELDSMGYVSASQAKKGA